MSVEHDELRFAIERLQEHLQTWAGQGLISLTEYEQLKDYYQQAENSCLAGEPLDFTLAPRRYVVLPLERQELESRILAFVAEQIRRQVDQRRLTAASAANVMPKVNEAIAALPPDVRAFAANATHNQPGLNDANKNSPGAVPTSPIPHRENLIERMLNPRSLQTLMACGGGLLVLGMVIWLWCIGVFENPLVVASILGAANLVLVAGGVAVVRRTRFPTAGRAIALLGCLILPLNLWFYDAQGLITLKNGGHLWIPALVACLVYVGVIRLLKDPLFVHALVAGVALTGLLFLAEPRIGHFWEIIAPTTLLVVLGTVCIHLERFFISGDHDFSREKFGRAFFLAGHVALIAGLLLLFAGCVAGLLYDPFFRELGYFQRPDVVVLRNVQCLALCLVVLASYTFAYSHFVVGRGRQYLFSAALTLLWAQVILLDIFRIEITGSVFTLLLAASGLMFNMLPRLFPSGSHKTDEEFPYIVAADMLNPIGMGLTFAAALFGMAQFLSWLFIAPSFAWLHSGGIPSTTFLGALGTTAIGAAVAARNQERRPAWGLAQTARVAAMFSTLALVISATCLFGGQLELGLVLAAAAVLVVVGMELIRVVDATGRNAWEHLEAGIVFLMALGISGWAGYLVIDRHTSVDVLPLFHIGLAIELALSAGWIAAVTQRRNTLVLATVAFWIALEQSLEYLAWTAYAPILSASFLGACGLLIARMVSLRHPAIARPSQKIGGSLLACGGLAGILLTLNRALGGGADWGFADLGFMANRSCRNRCVGGN